MDHQQAYSRKNTWMDGKRSILEAAVVAKNGLANERPAAPLSITDRHPRIHMRPSAISDLTVTVVIPTYNRGDYLLDTIRQVLAQDQRPDELIVVDQTSDYDATTESQLQQWHKQGSICRIRHSPPGLAQARNRAIQESNSDILIFVDDDIVLSPGFIQAHRDAYEDPDVLIVAGQILGESRPLHSGDVDDYELNFPLSHDIQAWVKNMGGGNFSVYRRLALEIGGFDQRFYQTAYCEESDFLFRFCRQYNCLARFEPTASLVHLAAQSGGCEAREKVSAPFSISYSVCDFYFSLRNLAPHRALARVVCRAVSRTASRYGQSTARRVWLFPLRAMCECIAFGLAFVRIIRGRELMSTDKHSVGPSDVNAP